MNKIILASTKGYILIFRNKFFLYLSLKVKDFLTKVTNKTI